MPVCYRKVGNRYYSPSEYKRLTTTVRRARRCPRCGSKDESYLGPCKSCGYPRVHGHDD